MTRESLGGWTSTSPLREVLGAYVRWLLAVLYGSGLDVHLRADEVEALVASAERLGNRLAAGVIAAAFQGARPA